MLVILQQDLFDTTRSTESNSQIAPELQPYVELIPNWLSSQQCDYLQQLFAQAVDWQQPEVKVFGRWHKIPRKQAWFGDEGLTYQYSGKAMHSVGWPEPLLRLKSLLEQSSGYRFNSTLLNWYRDGADKMGWHADDEPELGSDPVVAIVSVGSIRDIQFRFRGDKTSHTVSLTNGSLLLMKAGCQEILQHQIPQRLKVTESRFSLTFRFIHQ